MTKKDFEAIARVLSKERQYLDYDAFYRVVNALADLCEESNPQFGRERFVNACRTKT